MELEKAGLSTVAIVSEHFVNDASRSARAFGCPQFPFVVVPDVLTSISPDQISSEAEAVFEGIVTKLTTQPAAPEAPSTGSGQRIPPATAESFEGADLLDALHNMNEVYLDRGWGDGLPLIPPTPDAVDRMLSGTSRDRRDVVAVLQPGNGMATVEKIAINAVMAGCSPEHLPVLIAAVEAAGSPGFLLRNICQSTSAFGLLLLVNGPISKELGINSRQCALMPGKPSRVNVVIGRAMRLILLNIGHAWPQITDMSTVGSPRKYGLCVAENEDETPWEPFHVEKGFDRAASTVTVMGAGSDMTVADLGAYTGEEVAHKIVGRFNSDLIGILGAKNATNLVGCAHILISPDHAKIFAKDGWSKRAVKNYLHQHARFPKKWAWNKEPALVDPEWRWMLSLPDDYMLPQVESPDAFDLIVVGGEAGISLIILDYFGTVTKEIKR